MKKIKKFFSPISKGFNTGMTFKEWYFTGKNLTFPVAIFILISLVAVFLGPNTDWDYKWQFWASEGFFTIVVSVFIWQSLKRWNEMKN